MRLMRLLRTLMLLCFLAGCGEDPGGPDKTRDASLILTNARVYTLSWDDPELDGAINSDAPHDESG